MVDFNFIYVSKMDHCLANGRRFMWGLLSFIGWDRSRWVQSQVQRGTVITRSIFYANPHKMHPGRDMRCNLWFHTLIYILLQSTQCCMKYRISYYFGPRYNGTGLYLHFASDNDNWWVSTWIINQELFPSVYLRWSLTTERSSWSWGSESI